MKAIAYTALLYGLPYLEWAIRSVIDAVDEYHVLYTQHGSYGHAEMTPCPDSREALREAARRGAGDKLRWHEGTWAWEGQQRDSIVQYAPDADVILALDYDEIWPDGLASEAIRLALAGDRWGYRLPMVHFWRSFHRAVLHDPAYPVRVVVPGRGKGEETLHTRPIAHLGYAIPCALMRWKWQVHGHKAELRRDVDFFTGIYETNRQKDCHPVGSEYWNPETVNPADYLPDFMREHPYWSLEVIP